jgi:hypothetical protein
MATAPDGGEAARSEVSTEEVSHQALVTIT